MAVSKEDWDSALDLCSESLAQSADDYQVEAMKAKALLFHSSKLLFAEAAATAQNALARAHRSSAAPKWITHILCIAAQAETEVGEIDLALAHVEQSLAIDPDDGWPHSIKDWIAPRLLNFNAPATSNRRHSEVVLKAPAAPITHSSVLHSGTIESSGLQPLTEPEIRQHVDVMGEEGWLWFAAVARHLRPAFAARLGNKAVGHFNDWEEEANAIAHRLKPYVEEACSHPMGDVPVHVVTAMELYDRSTGLTAVDHDRLPDIPYPKTIMARLFLAASIRQANRHRGVYMPHAGMIVLCGPPLQDLLGQWHENGVPRTELLAWILLHELTHANQYSARQGMIDRGAAHSENTVLAATIGAVPTVGRMTAFAGQSLLAATTRSRTWSTLVEGHAQYMRRQLAKTVIPGHDWSSVDNMGIALSTSKRVVFSVRHPMVAYQMEPYRRGELVVSRIVQSQGLAPVNRAFDYPYALPLIKWPWQDRRWWDALQALR